MNNYFIGLDIGTESVGWAVTDTEYKMIKANGKALWGVRLFDEAESAAERRMHRTARRRYERRRQRLDWLKQSFSEEIGKVDPAFFIRMEESRFLEEDKRFFENGKPLGRYTLFADRNFCDKDYHKKYPTIFHLRKALMTEDHPFDVRLVYLAIHHILKNRGHFLFDGIGIDSVTFEYCLKELQAYLENEMDLHFTLADQKAFKKALSSRKMNTTEKKKALQQAAGFIKTDVCQRVIVDLVAGASVKLSQLFDREYAKADDTGFSFKNKFSDDDEGRLTDLLGDDMRLVYQIKRLYDWGVLEDLRGGEPYLSFAKVRTYEQHKEDLKKLKELFKKDPAAYKTMFRTARKKLNNYPAYVGHGSANYRCGYDDFKKYLKSSLAALSLSKQEKKTAEEILKRLDNEDFLLRQTSKNNGVIPHQLHEQELELILERASSYLPFLNETDGSGLPLRRRVQEMFRFRIPYYVGPLDTRSSHSWALRTHEKVTPWNFEQVVDLEQCAEKFIRRMTATCSYIGEEVLPKDSLLYSRFAALNMINKITVNGHPISVEAKQRLYNEKLVRDGKGTYASIKSYLLANGFMAKGDDLAGIDKEVRIALPAQKIFARILSAGDRFLMVEDIIKHIVLFGEDRKLMDRWLRKTYGHQLPEEDCAYIMRNLGSFNGWGKLSAQFLTEIKHADPDTGEMISVIDMLWQTNDNLMELLSARYTFARAVEAYRIEKDQSAGHTLDEYLRESYASPAIRRSIHQTVAIVSEIEKIMGGEPKRVFVEVTRGEEMEKKRTLSRKAQLEALYASCQKEEKTLYDQLTKCDEAALRGTKLYLYFTQLGRCMYSGKPIELSELATHYDIDHIHPRKKVKDDSLDNRVLVRKELNAAKSDRYPLSDEIRQSMRGHWSLLREKGLISAEKYRRLIRNTPFTDDELSGFIARQLVETSQSGKIVAELLRRRYRGEEKVVYVKAKNVAAFRQDQRLRADGTQAMACWLNKNEPSTQDPLFVKCREVNDFHHAKDAYLNIVVGNVYHLKFTRDPLAFVRSGAEYSMNRVFGYDVTRGGETAWRKGPEGSMAMVRRMMAKNNILFTRYAHEESGGFFDQNPVPKAENKVSLKASDPRMKPELYGGYDKMAGAYFCLVEYKKGKGRVRSIEAVMLMHKALYERDPALYCQRVLGLKECRILIPRIKINALFSLDGFRMNISSRTDNRIAFKNANQLVVSPEEARYIKQLAKCVERYGAKESAPSLTPFDGITKEANEALYTGLSGKLRKNPFAVKRASMAKMLEDSFTKFKKLSAYEQARVLLQILKLFNTSVAAADLSLLDGGGRAGLLRTSKDIKNDHWLLIHQSVTGVFEQQIDLQGDAF